MPPTKETRTEAIIAPVNVAAEYVVSWSGEEAAVNTLAPRAVHVDIAEFEEMNCAQLIRGAVPKLQWNTCRQIDS